MVALISVAALALLGLLWWWVVQPRGEGRSVARDAQIPLFTTRTPGRGVSIINPPLGRAGTGAVGDAPSEPVAERPRPTAPVATATEERVFTTAPRVEQYAVPDSPRRNGSAGNGAAGNGGAGNGGRGARPGIAAPTTGSRVSTAGAPLADLDRPPEGDQVDADAVRWGPPVEPTPGGTIQFLPGRLEVLQGRSLEGQEIRFVRPDRAGERAVVTFGRGEGAPYRHVQIKVPTVSRLHARMALEPGTEHWTLENLSATNPVAVNGVDLARGVPPSPLADGDRIEMGEVVFIFRAR